MNCPFVICETPLTQSQYQFPLLHSLQDASASRVNMKSCLPESYPVKALRIEIEVIRLHSPAALIRRYEGAMKRYEAP